MRRLAVLLAAVAALVLVPAQGAPADILDLNAGVFPDDELATLSSSGDPFAVGGGTLATGTHFAFSAHLGPSGYAVVSDPALGTAQGHVCFYLPQFSHVAAFAISVERGSGIYGSYPYFQFRAFDNGEAPSGTPDLLTLGGNVACSVGSETGADPVVQGNIVVRP
jgi:hypothetical protein